MEIVKKTVSEILAARDTLDTNYAIIHFMTSHLAVGFEKQKLQKIVERVLTTKYPKTDLLKLQRQFDY